MGGLFVLAYMGLAAVFYALLAKHAPIFVTPEELPQTPTQTAEVIELFPAAQTDVRKAA